MPNYLITAKLRKADGSEMVETLGYHEATTGARAKRKAIALHAGRLGWRGSVRGAIVPKGWSFKIEHVNAHMKHMVPALTQRTAGALRAHAALAHLDVVIEELGNASRDLVSLIGASPVYRMIVEAKREVSTAAWKLRDIADGDGKTDLLWLDREPDDRDGNPHAVGCGDPAWKDR